jgi:hypothetical protein
VADFVGEAALVGLFAFLTALLVIYWRQGP